MKTSAKAYFERCRYLDKRIDGMFEDLERMRELTYKATQSYSDMPGNNGSTSQSNVENGVLKLIEQNERLNKKIDELVDYRDAMRHVIECLSDYRHRQIMEWRYFSNWSWDRIAETLNCERMQVWRLHGRALQEAEQFIDWDCNAQQAI